MDFVWNCMDSSKIWYGSLDFLYGILRFCMINILSPNLGFCLEFHHNLRFLEIKVDKTPYGTR